MKKIISIALLLCWPCISAANGKLLATPGGSQLEGSAGGGLVPWAQLAGYASEDEMALSGYCTRASVDDFELDTCGVQANFFDRLEVSYAEQRFDVDPLALTLEQSIIGAKVRLYGDLVYSAWPQVSLGMQHKRLDSADIAFAVGAKEDSGTDVYLAASKLHLGLINGYNFLWNATVRYTQANEMGLLGFGGAQGNGALHAELSAAVLFNQHLAVGMEYRQKPDNLGLGEDDWRDVFVAWFPNKHISVTAAYVQLGSIATVADQDGWYLSITGYY
ncbi:DUF3034 family protein [Pseudoalteromonas sp. SSDWG2]|uniref:DUF3034 family protein n=1 Tax=Pseudoalteromonas sp. SSDWG2 TaxID=3139391 RepID=UPI003BA8D6A7